MSTQNAAKQAPPFAAYRWRNWGRQNSKGEKLENLKNLEN